MAPYRPFGSKDSAHMWWQPTRPKVNQHRWTYDQREKIESAPDSDSKPASQRGRHPPPTPMAGHDQEPAGEPVVPTALFIRALRTTDAEIPITHDTADRLATAILRTTNICSQSNVKECKNLITEYVLAPCLSSERTQVLCKYLVTLSKHFVPAEPMHRVQTDVANQGFDGLGRIARGKLQQPPQPAFKRLHILYIVHDLLLWSFKHASDPDHAMPVRTTVIEAIKHRLPALVGLASFPGSIHCAKTLEHVISLLNIWQKQELFDLDFLNALYATAQMADSAVESWPVLLERLLPNRAIHDLTMKIEKEPDWFLPVRHMRPGNPKARWHDLPAANGLHMRRKHGYPLQWRAFPVGGYKLQNGGRRADPEAIAEVKHLHDEMLHCFDKHVVLEDVQDVDALGNIIWKNPERETRNHWGINYDTVERRRELARHFMETCVGYAGYPLQPLPRPKPQRRPEPPRPGMNSARQQHGFGDRGGHGNRGGNQFRTNQGGYDRDHQRGGGSQRGGGHPSRGNIDKDYQRGGGFHRGGYSSRGSHDMDYHRGGGSHRVGYSSRGGSGNRGAYPGRGGLRDNTISDY